MKFFSEEVLLHSATAKKLYYGIKDLPIIDYHSHLPAKAVAEDAAFSTITGLWLDGDHYKWRAMRSCGIPERAITGDADDFEKFLAYASVIPKLIGNPLYYWTHFELKSVFGITEPLNERTAPAIYQRANEVLRSFTVRDLLKHFRVEYIATTDGPSDPLSFHGTFGGVRVCPTFRPDRAVKLDGAELEELGKAAGVSIRTLDDWKYALETRLAAFRQKGCTIADVSVEEMPAADVPESEAQAIFLRREQATAEERHKFYSYAMRYLGALFKKQGIVWQLHIGALRNVNIPAYRALGADAGYDAMRCCVDTDALAAFLNALYTAGDLPKLVLYTLNAAALPALCTVAGSFPDVRVGAAWWFNDTLKGIRSHLETLAEYSALGVFPGMLTDSRSFSSYCRFDFFRRILADFVAEKVDAGEYDGEEAEALLYHICYRNPKTFMNL